MTNAGMSLFVILHTLAGLFGIRPVRGKTIREWVPAITAVLLAGAFVAVLRVLHVTQHPRPRFFLGLSPLTTLLAGRALAGLCLALLVLALAGLVAVRRGPGILAPVLPLFVAGAMAALIVLVPSYYVAQADENPTQNQRQLLRTYLALRPYRAYIQRRDTVFLKGAYNLEMRYYLGMAEADTMDYSVFDEMKPDEGLATFLDRKRINLFFLDNARWSQMESDRPGVVQDLIEHGSADGWRLVGFKDQPTAAGSGQYLARWLLFRKTAPDERHTLK
jgi:hypothetical protein